MKYCPQVVKFCSLIWLNILVWPNVAQAQNSVSVSVDELIPIIELRQQFLECHCVYYTATIYQSGKWLTKMLRRPVKDRQWVEEGQYARKNGMRRSWGRKISGQTESDSAWKQEMFFISNSKSIIWKTDIPNQFNIVKQPNAEWENRVASEPPWSSAGEDVLYGIAQQIKERISRANLTIEKDNMILMTTAADNGYSTQIWLNPSQSYSVKKVEAYDPMKRLIYQCDAAEEMERDGNYYPKRGTRKNFDPDSGELTESHEFEVSQLITRKRDISDDLFHFKFPKDSYIYDYDNKVYVRDIDLTQSHLEEVVRNIEGTPRFWTRWWFLLIIFAVLATFLSYIPRMSLSHFQ